VCCGKIEVWPLAPKAKLIKQALLDNLISRRNAAVADSTQ
jgi:hypothetical protein